MELSKTAIPICRVIEDLIPQDGRLGVLADCNAASIVVADRVRLPFATRIRLRAALPLGNSDTVDWYDPGRCCRSISANEFCSTEMPTVATSSSVDDVVVYLG